MTRSLFRRSFAFLVLSACVLLPRLAAAQDLDETEVRTKKLLDLKKFAAEYGDHAFEVMDSAPDSPWLLCMETSPSYNAQLVMQAFKDALAQLYKLFKVRFGKLYDAKAFESCDVCLLYVFETRSRFAEFTKAAAWSGGEFDPARRALFIYKDTSQLYETLFREGARQLLAAIAGGKGDTTMAWLSMGVGTWLESFKRDATGGFVLGQKSAQYMPPVLKLAADRKLRKLDEFLKLTRADFEKESQDVKQRHALTGQAWAFWYFMQTVKDGAHMKQLDEYFKKEMEQKGGYEAAKECFGDLEALDTEFVEFLKAQK